jgi:hypothetical protein
MHALEKPEDFVGKLALHEIPNPHADDIIRPGLKESESDQAAWPGNDPPA